MIKAKTIRQIFILLLILSIGILIFKELSPYLSGVLGAITLFVLLKKFMSKLESKGWNSMLAAGVLMFISFIVITIPLAGVILMLSNKIGNAIDNSEKIIKVFKTELNSLESFLNYDLTSQIQTDKISGWLSENSQAFLGSTFNGFIAIALMYFLLYFMLINRNKVRESIYKYIPIGKDNLKLMEDDVYEMVKANALGIPLVAVAQGGVALIGFFIFGIPNPFFWAVIVTIGSMIPFVGSMLGTIPVFILSITNGETFQAWGILIYGILIVGATDNLIRLFVLKKLDNVHPLITLIGVLVGIPLFGFMGLIFGPLLVSLLLIIVRIYKEEYAHNNDDML
ncbi:AI-2E family transporter [Psychroserpens mesophilus]|uniref:AI-2E family transporter n=1 Tax=Psychroserpens mesophilus TaxID=325473 RepID=UPI003D654B04